MEAKSLLYTVVDAKVEIYCCVMLNAVRMAAIVVQIKLIIVVKMM